MDVGDHLTTLLTEGRLYAGAVDRAGWDAEVPSCPGWTVRDLVVHLGGVHRWVTAFVTEERSDPTSREERAAFGDHPDDAHLPDWSAAGLEGVADAIARADPALRCWTLWPAPPRAFWARRMMHETLVHRLDAEIAAGVDLTRVDPAVAADGIDELVVDFLPARAGRRLTSDTPRTVVVATADTDDTWALTVGPDGPVATEPPAAPDLTLRGTAADLYRTLWNRDGGTLDGVNADGDPAILELWRAGARV